MAGRTPFHTSVGSDAGAGQSGGCVVSASSVLCARTRKACKERQADAREMQGRCKGDTREMQGRCKGDAREMQGGWLHAYKRIEDGEEDGVEACGVGDGVGDQLEAEAWGVMVWWVSEDM